ncbi:MAG: hypothetical protein WCK67_12475 [bacterium]
MSSFNFYAALAIENQYSNQLLKVNIENRPVDKEVNITLYSSKPYKIKLDPKHMQNNEYVIFLPETYHSITTKPTVVSNDGSVKDVDVKLIPYIGANANNGYTKIIIKTTNDNMNFYVNNKVAPQNNTIDRDLSQIANKKSNAITKKQVSTKQTKIKIAQAVKPTKVIIPVKTIDTSLKQPIKSVIATKKDNKLILTTTTIPLIKSTKKATIEPKAVVAKDIIKTNDKSLIATTKKITPNEAVKKIAPQPIVEKPTLAEATKSTAVTVNDTGTVNKADNLLSQQNIQTPPVENVEPNPTKNVINFDQTQVKTENQKPESSNQNPLISLLAGIAVALITIIVLLKLLLNKLKKEQENTNKKQQAVIEERKQTSEQILSRLNQSKTVICNKTACTVAEKPIDPVKSFNLEENHALIERLQDSFDNYSSENNYNAIEAEPKQQSNNFNFYEVNHNENFIPKENTEFREIVTTSYSESFTTSSKSIQEPETTYYETESSTIVEDKADITKLQNIISELNLTDEHIDILEEIVRSNPRFSKNEDLLEEFVYKIIEKSQNLFANINETQTLKIYLNKIAKISILEVLKENSRL